MDQLDKDEVAHVFDPGVDTAPQVECFVCHLDLDVAAPGASDAARPSGVDTGADPFTGAHPHDGQQRQPGLLEGVPVAVKDIIGVAGTTMRAGSRVYEREITEDSAAVALLRAHGARILGTTRTHELALGPTGLNPHDADGGLKNPHDPLRIAGGSSSGSVVAVAVGLCPISLGTDTGGSVRAPAALSGVVGFKPSFGVIPLQGVLPASPTLDHIGVFGRRVADVGVAAEALGVSRAGTARHVLQGTRVGVMGTTEAVDPTVASALRGALDVLESRVASIESFSLATEDQLMDVSGTILFYEASRVHAEILAHRADDLSPLVLMRLQNGAKITSEAYGRALRRRQTVIDEMARLFERFDVIINPTSPVLAPLVADADDPAVVGSVIRNTRLANIVGNPALSLPLPGAQLPVGMQIAGARGNDQLVLQVAGDIEALLTE